MSDPVTNIEIEDVLSSIRRLVSEDTRFDPHPGRGGEETRIEAEEQARPDRLVLTPAQRVRTPEEIPQTGSQTDAVSGTEDHEDGAPTALADCAEDGGPETPPCAPVAVVTEDAEDDPAGQIVEFALTDTEAGAAAYDGSDEDAPVSDVPEDSGPEDAGPDDGGAMLLDDPLAAGVTTADEAPWSDPETTLYAAAQGRMPDGAGQDESGAGTLSEQGPATSDMPADQTPDPGMSEDVVAHAARVTELKDKIKALEAAIGRRTDTWEDEAAPRLSPEPGDHAGGGQAAEHVEWQDHAGGVPESEPEMDVLSVDEAVLDEDMLRELISDIVRQELQGALGERITRNVRKLVRREIHRALTVQDFE